MNEEVSVFADAVQAAEVRAGVRSRYPDVNFPDPVLTNIYYGKRDRVYIPDSKAIVDQNTGNVLSIVSDRYKLVHYEDIIHMVEGITSQIEGYGAIQLRPHTFSNGGKFKLSMSFPEAQHLIKAGDSIVPKLDILSSLDLSYKLSGAFGAWRLLCTNGMGTWEKFKKFIRKHLMTLVLADLQVSILEGMSLFSEQINAWKRWAEIEMTQDMYDNVWKALPFSEAERKKIEVEREKNSALNLLDALNQKVLTLWDFNNVLTQFATHRVQSEVRRVDLEPQIAKVLESQVVHMA